MRCEKNPAKIVRALAMLTGRDSSYVFNDRVQNGRARSIKVWGWSEKEYDLAADILVKHGHTVQIKEYRGQGYYDRGLKQRLIVRVK